jgi:hypothetical protein
VIREETSGAREASQSVTMGLGVLERGTRRARPEDGRCCAKEQAGGRGVAVLAARKPDR